MPKTLAVAVVHGMGAQRKDNPDNSADLSFSAGLHRQVRRIIGASNFDAKIEWREVYWANVLQDRQDAYFAKIVGKTDFDMLRRFVIFNLSDAASYRKLPIDDTDQTYHDVHKRVSGVFDALKDAVGDRAPLVIIAHSLGGHVMSNYIYDAQQENKNGTGAATPIQRMETVAKFITFGCNIPVFVFAYPESDVRPIAYPGSKLPTRLKMKPWWYNYFDRDDVLGFPLRDVSPRYAAMANDNRLADVEINAGSILTSWNPLSHNAYWTDEDFYRPVALRLSALM